MTAPGNAASKKASAANEPKFAPMAEKVRFITSPTSMRRGLAIMSVIRSPAGFVRPSSSLAGFAALATPLSGNADSG